MSAAKKGTSPAGEPKIILIADDQIGQDLRGRIDPSQLISVADEYDMLQELAKQECSAVIFSAPRGEIKALAQAVRRLNSLVKVVVFCQPEDEENIGEAVDDCRPYPPTQGELSLLMRELKNNATATNRTMILTADDLTTLIAGTLSEEMLAKRIMEIVSNQLGVNFSWLAAGACPPDIEPILTLPGKPAQLLVPCTPILFDARTDKIIDDLHRCVPALLNIARRTDALNRLAVTDYLTDAYNRRYFYHLTDRILSQAGQKGFRASLLLYDIDDFKRYNDEFGHAAGDEILRETASLIKQITREQDIVARIGGDEFAVLFWDSQQRNPNSQPLRDAWEIADRFRQAVARLEFASLGPTANGSLTISGGLATFPDHGKTCQELLRQADNALRKAKVAGKNLIHLIGQN